MLRKLVVFAMLVVCCYCEENNVILAEETRAKKTKKTLKLLAMVALFVLTKLAIVKVASFFFFFAFFQKLFSVGGVLLTYFMKTQLGMALPAPPPPAPPSPSPPSTSYGSPTDYNTLGYSYGPPDHEAAFQSEGPGLADFGGPFNWILHKP